MKWTDWSGAVPVDEVRRSEWAMEALEYVRRGQEVCDITSGDTVVIAIRRGDEVTIYDAKIRREATVQLEDPTP